MDKTIGGFLDELYVSLVFLADDKSLGLDEFPCELYKAT